MKISSKIKPPHNNRPKRLLLKATSYLSIVHSKITSCKSRDSNNHILFQANIINMKIAKKKVRIQTPLLNSIIDLERPLEKVLSKGEYMAIKCHNTPGDNDSGSYEINLPYYRGGSPEERFVWKDKLLKALDGQSISTGPLRYTFTERLLTGDAKATFNQAALDIGVHTFDNFNKVPAEMTEHAFPACVFREQKRYLRRHLVKPLRA